MVCKEGHHDMDVETDICRRCGHNGHFRRAVGDDPVNRLAAAATAGRLVIDGPDDGVARFCYVDCGCPVTDHLPDEQCKGLLANATERWADDMPRDLTGAVDDDFIKRVAEAIAGADTFRSDYETMARAAIGEWRGDSDADEIRGTSGLRRQLTEASTRAEMAEALVYSRLAQLEAQNARLLNENARLQAAQCGSTDAAETIAGVTYLGQPWGGDYRQRTDEIVVRKPSVIFREIVNGDMRPLGVQMRLAPEIVRRNVLSETPTIRRGEFITCEAGHLICEAIGDIRHGQVGYAANLGAWRLETPPQPGEVDPRCPCGALYFKLSPGPSLHVKGRGWV